MAYTLKAALMTGIEQPLELAELEITGCTYGQVFVRVLVSGICGAQLKEIDGSKESGPLPHPLGHEGCGIVEWVGAGVTKVKSGDKVVLHWRRGDGIESDFPRYIHRSVSQEITGGKVTTFNDWAVVSENRLTPVPKDTPDDFCALLGCSLSTALGTIEHEAKVKFGESVMIIGCGGLGLNLILAARLAQAGYIQAVDIAEGKEGLARRMGADYFTNDCSRVRGADVIIDTSGHAPTIGCVLHALNPSGRFIMVGQPTAYISIPGCCMFEGEGKTIKATQGGCFNPSVDIPRYIALFNRGGIDTEKIISHRVKLDDINDGLDLVRQGKAGRVLVDMV